MPAVSVIAQKHPSAPGVKVPSLARLAARSPGEQARINRGNPKICRSNRSGAQQIVWPIASFPDLSV
jgi:hypothetical protein